MSKTHNVIIIGSGPAGYTSAIYAARAGMQPLIIQGIQPGGQLLTTTYIENYPGFAKPIQGPWLINQMELQAKACGAEIIFDHVDKVDFNKPKKLEINCSSGKTFISKTCIIATGANAKWLGLKNEEKYKGYGVSSCAVCDGMFFKDQNVLVVGGGNTAIEDALYLSKITSKVTLIHRRKQLRADHAMQQKLFSNKKINIIWDTVLKDIYGTNKPKKVTGVEIQNIKNNTVEKLDVMGVFIAVGHKPATEIFQNCLDIDEYGYIQTTPGSTATKIEGVFAAGDAQDAKYRQAITAAGTGCIAALEAQRYLENE
ncbi:Thioredoxin reductase [Candidatus Xenohaliotis californiensis]|uniref:Thioredoxin reductase n=1 Tax=Candidatus Xenohaliotis californiensis TaxID=84677 RepID=A0ABM9N841_9RICK|nr:Thioredoxin reductase [Candidatus Xenohaliotis californiensis]